MSELEDLLADLTRDAASAAPHSLSGPLWKSLQDVDLIHVSLDEDRGGGGGGFHDALVVVERMAETALSAPMVEAALLGARVAERTTAALPKATYTVALASEIVLEKAAGGTHLAGMITGVAWAAEVTQLLVVIPSGDQTVVVALPRDQVDVEPGHNIAGEPRDNVTLDLMIDGDQLHLGPNELWDELAVLACFGRTCQIAGAARAATALAVEHASSRTQFGKPIGAQQAVAHLLVEMAAESAAVDAIVASARDELSEIIDAERGPQLRAVMTDRARLTVSAARVQAGRAAELIARNAHQVHGAIGVASEHPLHRLSLRLWSWPYEYGTPRDCAAQLGQSLIGNTLWSVLAGS